MVGHWSAIGRPLVVRVPLDVLSESVCRRGGANSFVLFQLPFCGWQASRFIDSDEKTPVFSVVRPPEQHAGCLKLLQHLGHIGKAELFPGVRITAGPYPPWIDLEHSVRQSVGQDPRILTAKPRVHTEQLLGVPKCFTIYNPLRHWQLLLRRVAPASRAMPLVARKLVPIIPT